MFLRRGYIEVELFRRYGRTPAGTRAVGWFELSEDSGPYMTHVWELHLQIADEPRVVWRKVYFPWQRQRIDEPYTRMVFDRGTWQSVSAADLFEYVVQDVVRLIEGLETRAKYQRFRVVRAEWQDGVAQGGHEGAASAAPGTSRRDDATMK